MEHLMNEPTYKELAEFLARKDSPALRVLKSWMVFRKRKLNDGLCEQLCGANWNHWTTASGQFWKFYEAKYPAIRDNGYHHTFMLRELRQAAMRLTSMHRHPQEAAQLELLRKSAAEKAEAHWSRYKMPHTVKRFIEGDVFLLSNQSKITATKLDALCGFEPGTLLAACRAALRPALAFDLQNHRMGPVSINSTLLPLSERISKFVESYKEHKTSLVPALRRFTRWSQNFKGDYPSFIIFESQVRRRFSFMVRAKCDDPADPHHGLGMDPEKVEVIDLFRSEIAIAHFKWAVSVRKGLSKAFAWTFFQKGIAMINEESGFLFQQPELYSHGLRASERKALKGRTVSEKFQTWCRQEYKAYWDFVASLELRDAQVRFAQVRRSQAKIDAILETRQPITALFDLIDAHKARGKSGNFLRPDRDVSHHASTFFLAAITASPLRLLTWSALKLGKHVFRKDGRWHLRIERALFKNRKYMKSAYYEVSLPHWVTEYYDTYVENIRPKMLGAVAGSPYLFVRCEPSRFKHLDAGPVPVGSLRTRLCHITKMHWGACVGPHSWRHIIATAILKDDAAAVTRAAHVLNDAPETIEKSYAHLTTRETYLGFAEWTDRLRKEHRQNQRRGTTKPELLKATRHKR
jgi:hypothetical protein